MSADLDEAEREWREAAELMDGDELAERDRAYDLAQVRAARPKGRGECRQCCQIVRARFPVLIGCQDRVVVQHLCGRCVMTAPDPDEWRYYVFRPSRADCERLLAPTCSAPTAARRLDASGVVSHGPNS